MIRLPAICLLLLFLLPCRLLAQFGNEWVRHEQQFVKVGVAKNGLYRIRFSALEAAGLSVGDESRLQLFHRGQEIAMNVGADYIEFYGVRNDGTLDRELYDDESFQPHRLYNLFSDTTWYFVTTGPASGKRFGYYQENSSSIPAETYWLSKELRLHTATYSQGRDYGEVFKTTFDEGEGWMGSEIWHNEATRYDTIANLGAVSAGGPKPVLEIVLTGRSKNDHSVNISIGASGRMLTSVVVKGYETRKLVHQIEWSDITSGKLPIGIKVNTANASSARVSVNYFQLSYARQTQATDAPADFFNLRANPEGKSFLSIGNAPEGSRLFDITDPANPVEVGGDNLETLHAVVRSTTVPRSMMLANSVMEPAVKPVNFSAIDPSAYNYIIISHPALRQAAGGYADPVEAYAAYRASTAGGAFSPLVANIEELYDQFNYGEQSPLAIFHFLKYLASVRLPDYVFLIGKGLDPDYNYFRNPGVAVDFKTLVPSAGMPGSDMLFSAGLDGTPHVPAIPTGRITAMRASQVAAYLDKVKEAEARPFNDLTRKHILHLSGGVYPGEPVAFRSFLEGYATTARGTYLGGRINAVAKEATDIKLVNIAEQVNKGVGLITFFGHSSAVTLDFDVGKASDDQMGYRNEGKYPVMLMNGCLAGSFFRYAELFGEDWIHVPNRGAVAFIAHSSFGNVGLLRKYSDLFYKVGFADSSFITRGLGDIQKEVATRYLQQFGASAGDITQVQQMLLLGDPAVRLFGAEAPDYSVEDENLFMATFDDQPLTTASDSFALRFIVRNYGLAPDEPFTVRVIRTMPDNSTVTYDSTYSPVLYSDTLTFVLHDAGMAGHNVFEVRIDADQFIDELREDNNAAFIEYFVPDHGTRNLFPVNCAIVGDNTVSLAFQHTDLHSDVRNFILELDTTAAFNSTFRQTFNVAGKVLARQPVQLLDKDTIVYYWRTRLADPGPNENTGWAMSSFTFINDGPAGWSQSHFPQYLENDLTGFYADTTRRKLGFIESSIPIYIRTFGADAGGGPQDVSVIIDGAEYNFYGQGFGCRDNTINLIAFDNTSTAPYQGISFEWYNSGGRGCGRVPWVINSFYYTELLTGNDDDMIAYVDNIQPGDSVVLYNIGNANYELWPEQVKIKLGEVGISVAQLNALASGEPVVIFGRKGISAGSARVVRSGETDPLSAELQVSGSVTGRFNAGKMQTDPIGPALSWHRLYFDLDNATGNDIPFIAVYGIDARGGETLILDSLSEDADIAGIDAGIYPYVRLVYRTSDPVDLTASQLGNWMVTYDPAPEGIVFFNGPRQVETVREGMTWSGMYGFVNVSDADFTQPLMVSYKVINHESVTTFGDTVAIAAAAAGDTTLFTIPVSTIGRPGMHDVEVFVNPRITPERYYDNNVITMSDQLNVSREIYRPVIDVTIDGRYVLRDEFVSADAQIVITIWDENEILRKNDTTGVEVLLSGPCSGAPCAFRRISFSEPAVDWFPATDSTHFRIVFLPGPLEPGQYFLSVTAADQTGNASGEIPYMISFQYSEENVIMLSPLFPNPVTETINIDLTLSEHSSGDELTLEIFQLSGHLVREYRISGSGLHVGNNHIRIPFEARLPAGMYIYRVRFTGAAANVQNTGKIAVVR